MEDKPETQQNAPWWLKGVLDIGHAFGVSAILLGFYMLQSAGVIPNPVEDELQEVKGQLVAHLAVTQTLMKAVEDHNKQYNEDTKAKQLRCVLKAKNEAEKRSCFPKEG